MRTIDCVIIGGGSAGLAAAIHLKELGTHSILLLEKEAELGGILNQCIHNGFGLQRFKVEMAGPSYAQMFVSRFIELGIEYRTDACVSQLTESKLVTYIHPDEGVVTLQAKTIILAMGARERTRGNIAIAGDRPVGVWTAGNAQKYLNMEGYLVGKRIFILGSGDIGLIMARRLTLAGAQVIGVAELMPYSNGLNRNIVQCLHDFNIPLYLSTTLVSIHGQKRVERITLAPVDENLQPILESVWEIDVDTVLLSVGLIPDNVLSTQAKIALHPVTKGPQVTEKYETNVSGIFACGNVLHIHDVVDYVSEEGEQAALAAHEYLSEEQVDVDSFSIHAGESLAYVLPARGLKSEHLNLKLRVKKPMNHVKVEFSSQGKVLLAYPKEHLVPAEMEILRLPASIAAKIEGELTLSVVPQ